MIYLDQNQNNVISGGPFTNLVPTIIKDSFCLAPSCYTFKLYDSFGDGILSQGTNCGAGFYKLIKTDSTIVSQLTPDSATFGNLYTSSFCAILEEKDSIKAIKIYPNPSNTTFTIYSNNSKINSIELTSLTGQIIYQNNDVNNNLTKVDASNLARGIYLIRIQSENEIICKSLVVE